MIRIVALTFALFVPSFLELTTTPAHCQTIEVRSYQVTPGSTYTYKPSPEGPGIPGGMPDQYQLDFGVLGMFDVEYDDAADTARLFNVELTLTGNEAVQMNPPGAAPVTADRVEDFLEARLFHNQFVAAPWDQYQEETYDDFYFFDFLQGLVELRGGFDGTPADGQAMLFNVRALIIPEPPSGMIFLMGGVALLTARMHQSNAAGRG